MAPGFFLFKKDISKVYSDEEMESKIVQEKREKMRECFGLQLGFGPEGMAPELREREKCYNCQDFDECYKYCLVRALISLRFEIRTGVQGIRQSLGGSHSAAPLW